MTTPPVRTPFRLFAAGLAFAALLATGCGVEATGDATGDVTAPVVDKGEAPDTTVDEPTDTTEDTPPETTVDDEPDETTTTEPDVVDEPAGPSGDLDAQVIDQLTDLYVDMGFTQDQASCLAGKILDSGSTEFDPSDTGEIMAWFEQCDISLSDLSKIGGA